MSLPPLQADSIHGANPEPFVIDIMSNRVHLKNIASKKPINCDVLSMYFVIL